MISLNREIISYFIFIYLFILLNFNLGLLTNALVKKYPIRVVGVSAALIFSMPNIITAFVTHVYQLAVIFFIQGIGLGLMNIICSANFNAYFVRKRAEVNKQLIIINSIKHSKYYYNKKIISNFILNCIKIIY